MFARSYEPLAFVRIPLCKDLKIKPFVLMCGLAQREVLIAQPPAIPTVPQTSQTSHETETAL